MSGEKINEKKVEMTESETLRARFPPERYVKILELVPPGEDVTIIKVKKALNGSLKRMKAR